MAVAAVTNTFVNLTPADATEVNANFQDVIDFLNDNVVHRDGTKAMTAAFDAGSLVVSNVATGVATTDAVNKAQMDALATPSAWAAVTFQNSWTDSGGGLPPTKYRKVGDMVHVRLACSTGASNTVAFTLPAAHRPPFTLRVQLDGAGAYAYGVIETTGTVTLVGVASIQGEFQFSVTA